MKFDGTVNVADVQLEITKVVYGSTINCDVNLDELCNVSDIQAVINSVWVCDDFGESWWEFAKFKYGVDAQGNYVGNPGWDWTWFPYELYTYAYEYIGRGWVLEIDGDGCEYLNAYTLSGEEVTKTVLFDGVRFVANFHRILEIRPYYSSWSHCEMEVKWL